ncbi:MAG: hypothetical protein KAR84_03490 [Elusimicrobiales bacterium]|nr:hypothetical protein [Elusimicrobiales bacterium]
MQKKPVNCANYLIPKLCDKKILTRDNLREKTQGDDIHYMDGNEMLEHEKQNFEICGRCSNFLQKSVKKRRC